jgi:hypothetical protein
MAVRWGVVIRGINNPLLVERISNIAEEWGISPVPEEINTWDSDRREKKRADNSRKLIFKVFVFIWFIDFNLEIYNK